MLSKRIIPRMPDVRAGKLTKGVKFQGNVDIGDVETARRYYEEGADEIVFTTSRPRPRGAAFFSMWWSGWRRTLPFPFSVGGE